MSALWGNWLASFKRLLGKSSLEKDAFEQLEALLYEADFGVEITPRLLQNVQTTCPLEALNAFKQTLNTALEGAEGRLDNLEGKKPYLITLVGANGGGKTTTAVKLGSRFLKEGKKVLLGSCDTFRAAANAQLEESCQALSLDCIRSQRGADAAAVAFDCVRAAQARQVDVLILDTAGRLQNKVELLRELGKLFSVAERELGRPLDEKWLVLDASLGAHLLEQAKAFHHSLSLTGLILTKVDGSQRGGALLRIWETLKLPIYFLGQGEAPEDLEAFQVRLYLERLLEPEAGN